MILQSPTTPSSRSVRSMRCGSSLRVMAARAEVGGRGKSTTLAATSAARRARALDLLRHGRWNHRSKRRVQRQHRHPDTPADLATLATVTQIDGNVTIQQHEPRQPAGLERPHPHHRRPRHHQQHDAHQPRRSWRGAHDRRRSREHPERTETLTASPASAISPPPAGQVVPDSTNNAALTNVSALSKFATRRETTSTSSQTRR